MSECAMTFDGIICFGGVDWWYHNRGHYDLQMMRELSKKVPILYVNSIGMRRPTIAEGTMFIRRVSRKIKSLSHGLTQVRTNFHVLSVIALPGGENNGFMARLTKQALVLQIKRAAKLCGIRRPMLWFACPPAAIALDELCSGPIVYQRTDRYEDFPGVNVDIIKKHDRFLKERADLVVYCSANLYEREKVLCLNALFVDHGVDFERFEMAGRMFEKIGLLPLDMKSIPSPRVGFVGGIDAHTFDSLLFKDVVRQLPDINFVMVGQCSLPDGWCDQSNVFFLGQKPYEEVSEYMAACDVLIMPWNQSNWIKACNPVKLKEYLAVGRPIISTFFWELTNYENHVVIARSAEEFVEAIGSALHAPGDSEVRRNRVHRHTWAAKADEVWNALTNRVAS